MKSNKNLGIMSCIVLFASIVIETTASFFPPNEDLSVLVYSLGALGALLYLVGLRVTVRRVRFRLGSYILFWWLFAFYVAMQLQNRKHTDLSTVFDWTAATIIEWIFLFPVLLVLAANMHRGYEELYLTADPNPNVLESKSFWVRLDPARQTSDRDDKTRPS